MLRWNETVLADVRRVGGRADVLCLDFCGIGVCRAEDVARYLIFWSTQRPSSLFTAEYVPINVCRILPANAEHFDRNLVHSPCLFPTYS